MKNYLKAGFCIFLVLSSCNDEKDGQFEKSYSLFCWPSKTPCDNREYGIEFSYKTLVISADTPNITYRRTATLVCCRYIEALVDTLAAFNDSLINHKNNLLGDLDLRCNIGPDIEVFVNYSIDLGLAKPFTYSSLGFTDKSHPFGFTLDVPQQEYFSSFRNDVLAIYRKCCLREKDN